METRHTVAVERARSIETYSADCLSPYALSPLGTKQHYHPAPTARHHPDTKARPHPKTTTHWLTPAPKAPSTQSADEPRS